MVSTALASSITRAIPGKPLELSQISSRTKEGCLCGSIPWLTRPGLGGFGGSIIEFETGCSLVLDTIYHRDSSCLATSLSVAYVATWQGLLQQPHIFAVR
jgi:hypothetical protein